MCITCPCRNVDRLQAAPPAAAARPNAEGQQRPEQPYLSYDAATKAAHEAWQPQEEAGWRKVLTQKKHRQANKAQIEAAERENAAKFIQVRGPGIWGVLHACTARY
jgi:hypothetical protein